VDSRARLGLEAYACHGKSGTSPALICENWLNNTLSSEHFSTELGRSNTAMARSAVADGLGCEAGRGIEGSIVVPRDRPYRIKVAITLVVKQIVPEIAALHAPSGN
jgi:hypothetical protein